MEGAGRAPSVRVRGRGAAGRWPAGAAAAGAEANEASETVTGLDGLIVAGGPDVDPVRYGQARHPKTQPSVPVRDAWDLAVIGAALTQGVALLAICRGMQVLNVCRGGTLHQHVPDLVGHERHEGTPGVYARHRVRADSCCGAVGGGGRGPCDCFLGYATGAPARIVRGRAGDRFGLAGQRRLPFRRRGGRIPGFQLMRYAGNGWTTLSPSGFALWVRQALRRRRVTCRGRPPMPAAGNGSGSFGRRCMKCSTSGDGVHWGQAASFPRNAPGPWRYVGLCVGPSKRDRREREPARRQDRPGDPDSFGPDPAARRDYRARCRLASAGGLYADGQAPACGPGPGKSGRAAQPLTRDAWSRPTGRPMPSRIAGESPAPWPPWDPVLRGGDRARRRAWPPGTIPAAVGDLLQDGLRRAGSLEAGSRCSRTSHWCGASVPTYDDFPRYLAAWEQLQRSLVVDSDDADFDVVRRSFMATSMWPREVRGECIPWQIARDRLLALLDGNSGTACTGGVSGWSIGTARCPEPPSGWARPFGQLVDRALGELGLARSGLDGQNGGHRDELGAIAGAAGQSRGLQLFRTCKQPPTIGSSRTWRTGWRQPRCRAAAGLCPTAKTRSCSPRCPPPSSCSWTDTRDPPGPSTIVSRQPINFTSLRRSPRAMRRPSSASRCSTAAQRPRPPPIYGSVIGSFPAGRSSAPWITTTGAAAAPPGGHFGLLARIRLAAAMLGRDEGEPSASRWGWAGAGDRPRAVREVGAGNGRPGRPPRAAANSPHRPLTLSPTGLEPKRLMAFDGDLGQDGWPPPFCASTDWVARQLAIAPAGDVLPVSDRFQVAAIDLGNARRRWTCGWAATRDRGKAGRRCPCGPSRPATASTPASCPSRDTRRSPALSSPAANGCGSARLPRRHHLRSAVGGQPCPGPGGRDPAGAPTGASSVEFDRDSGDVIARKFCWRCECLGRRPDAPGDGRRPADRGHGGRAALSFDPDKQILWLRTGTSPCRRRSITCSVSPIPSRRWWPTAALRDPKWSADRRIALISRRANRIGGGACRAPPVSCTRATAGWWSRPRGLAGAVRPDRRRPLGGARCPGSWKASSRPVPDCCCAARRNRRKEDTSARCSSGSIWRRAG